MKRDKQTYIIERNKKQQRIEKFREKKYSKKDVENMNLLLIEAKKLLGY